MTKRSVFYDDTTGMMHAANVYVAVDTSPGPQTYTLPTAVGATPHGVKNTGSNILTINTTASQTIDGAATLILQYHNSAVLLVPSGGNWVIH